MQHKSASELTESLKKCLSPIGGAALFSFFINLAMLVSPLYMMQVYDRVLQSRSGATLVMLTRALATGAWEGSLTKPDTVARYSCASALPKTLRKMRTARLETMGLMVLAEKNNRMKIGLRLACGV